MSDELLIDHAEGITTLTFNRPHAKNALDLPMRAALREAVHAIRADRNVRAVILRGSEGNFCSGGDVRGMNVESAEAGRNRVDDLHGWVAQLLELDRPVIAAVDGVAYGAGFSFALAADFVIATPRARFCMPFMKVGLVPDCGALYTLPRIVGMARARDLIFTAREANAEEARAMGIVLEIAGAEALDARANAIARALASASPAAFALTKRALNASLTSDLRTMLELESLGQGLAFSTDFHREAVQRFRDKATPLFHWPQS
ncbi:enoyl-CoA hydratase/isomerase family protein [Paraburkholderia acidisoli]|uniref:Enoyl-CoA hydratase/isomerase family protein n=1 Tax=Paraburkholderia acidisoli TaxID=2571748 RepID=A0A7Z2JH49_9BURK|nr:enoyl-CoA hydratase/isomerase family protein [Paraburkholderia acidisoli]QGZ63039.1 enoyl-CoA hydratase/isomerase family protein [Paraburkholderia acidisoli]